MGEKLDLADAIAEEAKLLEDADEADADENVETAAEENSDEQDVEEAVETEEAEEIEAEAEDSEEELDEGGNEPESLEPLEHWSEEVKSAFNRVDPEAQQAWIDQHKTFQRGYNELVEKSKGFEDQLSSGAEVNNILKEFEPLWRAQGMNVAQGVGQLTQWAYALSLNPSEVLPQLAQIYGIDLGDLGRDAPYVAPEDRARDSRMNNLEQRISQQDAAAAKQQQNQLIGQIEAFRDTTDADGNVLNVHFDAVIDQITGMYQSGYKGQLSDAYEQACWTNPEVRQKMIQGVETQTVQKTALQRQADAKRARKASGQRVRQTQAPIAGSGSDDMELGEFIEQLAKEQLAHG